MAAMNSSVLACSYAISGGASSSSSELSPKLCASMAVSASSKLPVNVIRAQQVQASSSPSVTEGRRAALTFLAATIFTTAASAANAGVIEDYLEKSKANKVIINPPSTYYYYLLLLLCNVIIHMYVCIGIE